MSIDWSKAPEGATHWQPENSRLMAAWIKVSQGKYWFRMPYMDNWVVYSGPVVHLGELIAKPLYAADQREKDIEELRVLLSKIACDDYHAAVAMIDAGYRKQEAP